MAVFDSNSKLLNHIYQKKKSDSRWGSKNSSKKKRPKRSLVQASQQINYSHSLYLHNWDNRLSRDFLHQSLCVRDQCIYDCGLLHSQKPSHQKATFLLNQDRVPCNIITHTFLEGTVSFSMMRTTFQTDAYSYLPHLFYCPLLQETLGLWVPKMSKKTKQELIKPEAYKWKRSQRSLIVCIYCNNSDNMLFIKM